MDSHHTETVDPDDLVVDLAILAPGTLVASRYEIERLLGTGGFARVYAALDRRLDQRIAIKILRSDRITPATLARLRREVSIAREIPRDTLVRVYDLGQDGEHTFLTMELVEGETLRDRIRRGAMDIEEIVRVSEPILDALGALHAAGVVHRDLKPANILLTPSGAVKLADFGLARRWEGGEKVTRTEALVGTLEYVAPEQALGKQLDGRADLYAFGVLLFEMLTARLPLAAGTNLGTVMAHIISAAPDVRTLRGDVPAWLAELIQRLMEKEPAARPQTASGVLEIIRARKRDLGWRWRRSRARVAVYAVTAVVVVAGCFGAWHAYWSAFDHLEADAGRALRAIDRRGEVLWKDRALVPGLSAAVVKIDGKTPVVVGVPEAANRLLPIDEAHRLRVYDASTGEVEKEMRVADAADLFPLDPTFSAEAIAAVDPDHDGREDVLLTYMHSPYWGSYSVYVDPRNTQSTPIFVASGHHRFVGMADIDGDGVDELFFAGMNNRMGWFAGIGAVKLVRQSAAISASSPWIEAGTPDAEYARSSSKSLPWYVLLPRMNDYRCRLVGVDAAKRTLRFEFRGGEIAELDFDGFAAGVPALPGIDRRAERVEAYARLRDALRASTNGAYEDALRFVREAHSKADAIGEAPLVNGPESTRPSFSRGRDERWRPRFCSTTSRRAAAPRRRSAGRRGRCSRRRESSSARPATCGAVSPRSRRARTEVDRRPGCSSRSSSFSRSRRDGRRRAKRSTDTPPRSRRRTWWRAPTARISRGEADARSVRSGGLTRESRRSSAIGRSRRAGRRALPIRRPSSRR